MEGKKYELKEWFENIFLQYNDTNILDIYFAWNVGAQISKSKEQKISKYPLFSWIHIFIWVLSKFHLNINSCDIHIWHSNFNENIFKICTDSVAFDGDASSGIKSTNVISIFFHWRFKNK